MKVYTVTIGGIEHTMQLSDEDAKRYGDAAKLVASKSSDAPNKARSAKNKSA